MSFHICFFLFFVQFSLSIVKTKTKNHKRKKKKEERKKRSNWTKLPRKSKEENNNNNRQRPNQKEKIIIIIIIKKKEQAQYGIYRPNQKEKKKERGNGLDKSMCKYTWVFSSFTYQISLTQFSSYFEEKIFCWVQGENTWTLPIFFSLLP